MSKVIVYGIGGHDSTKPNNNIVEEYEVESFVEEPTNVELITQSLLNLPPETLSALIQALQIGENNG